MPAVQPPATVLVTGASGFIAAWVVQRFLDKGFTVVGTVRSADKGEYLKKTFASYGDRFSYVIVGDIAADGAFNEAVKNVDAVAHTASPFHFNVKEPDEMIGPAVKGTIGILESIQKHGPRVKRVVVTSSVAAISDKSGDHVHSESEWNDVSTREVEEKGAGAGPVAIYCASKTIAERGVYKFVQDHKVGFDVATINPPWVFGPTLHPVSSVNSLGTSIAHFRSALFDSSLSEEHLTKIEGSWVDVRNVADAHVDAITHQAASGERFITAAGFFRWQDFLTALADSGLKTNKGFPDVPVPTADKPYSSGAKAEKVLGIKYYDLKTTGYDTAKSLVERFP